jgi:CheY-like chemotaxis protein
MGVTDDDDGGRQDWADVLLVEADPADARLISCGFQRQSVTTDVAPDGRTAIERLSTASDERTDDRLPRLIVLDLAIGPLDAETILHAVKSSPRLGLVPVVTLSDSDEHTAATDTDAERAYDLGANAHFSKPDDVERYVDGIERLAAFWFEWATFPPELLSVDGA